MAAAPAPAPARRTGAVPVATVACFRCHQPDRFYATHLCDLCEARKHALLGVSMVEVSIWYSFLMKELVGRAFRPGDARKDGLAMGGVMHKTSKMLILPCRNS